MSVRIVKYTDIVGIVRGILNMPSSQELSDAAIELAVQRASMYVDSIARRSVADPDVVELAKINYAAYLAYQTYSDRIQNELPGTVSSDGVWDPVGEVIMRETREKLALLKRTAYASIAQIHAYGLTGRLVRPGWLYMYL